MSERLLKVGVLGALGKVGTEVCRAVEEAPDTELVARVDADDSLDDLVAAGAEVVVDFTHPDVVMDNLEFCVEQGSTRSSAPPASTTTGSPRCAAGSPPHRRWAS